VISSILDSLEKISKIYEFKDEKVQAKIYRALTILLPISNATERIQ